MLLNDGVVFFCDLVNDAPIGRKPEYKLRKIAKHWFGERTVGFSRQYQARGVNEQVDMLIRVHRDKRIRVGMYAVLGYGEQFRIGNVQQVIDETLTGLKMTDVSIERLDKNYDYVLEA